MLGLQPKTVAVDCLRLSKPQLTPEGWNKDAIDTLSQQWKTSIVPEGKNLWLRTRDGHTQYLSPFIAEVEGATIHLEDDHRQACWGEVSEPGNDIVRQEVVEFAPPMDKPAQARDTLTKTVPKARFIPNKVVVNTTGAHYERWKQATAKELQAFFKAAWKEPTQELWSRYFAVKKKVVMQLLVFSFKPMTAEKNNGTIVR